jgi:chorismate dehydratase
MLQMLTRRVAIQAPLLYWSGIFLGRNHVNSLRISIVQYLNTAPLVRGFTHGPLRGKYQLSFTVPSQCAEALRAGEVDIAILPVIEYQRIPDLVVLPNLSISSKKSVRSLLLVSQTPIREARRIALDRSSRSTQALVRILCQKHWRISPEFFDAEPDLPAMLKQADAALLIGDPALRLALEGERSAGPAASERLHIYDVVEQWRELTSLPAVLAVWAARREVITQQVISDFQQSLAFGMEQLDPISSEASRELHLPAEKLHRYLRENIDYTLDTENLRGLERYFDLARETGLIERAKTVEIASPVKTGELAGAGRA